MILSLAIVIPAYKSTFLRETLASIAGQTCKDFSLYIGNDAGTREIDSIVEEYRSSLLNLEYVYFDNNLGQNDLVAQWNRVLSMVRSERWVWLFSDDDIMGATCVEHFYQTISQAPSFDLYHFDVARINREGEVLQHLKAYSAQVNAANFFRNITIHRYNSYMVEYIFRKESLLAQEGIVPFDLAWGSDHATCIQMAYPQGIYTIKGDVVYWRESGENITSLLTGSANIALRKVRANIAYYHWVAQFFKKKEGKAAASRRELLPVFLRQNKRLLPQLTWKQIGSELLRFTSNPALLSYAFLYVLTKKLFK